MAWCRQATSHYLSQCWPRSLLPYGVIRRPWVKHRGYQERNNASKTRRDILHYNIYRPILVSDNDINANIFQCFLKSIQHIKGSVALLTVALKNVAPYSGQCFNTSKKARLAIKAVFPASRRWTDEMSGTLINSRKWRGRIRITELEMIHKIMFMISIGPTPFIYSADMNSILWRWSQSFDSW